MNSVCTIVSKIWYPYALTLAESLKKIHPEIPFHILLLAADNDEDFNKELPYHITKFKDIDIKNYKEIVFKYSLKECCGFAKPFFIQHLFKKYDYDNIIFLDSDIYIYDRIDLVFEFLEKNFILLSPHIISINKTHQGLVDEKFFLASGVFNSGFIGFKKCIETFNVLEWLQRHYNKECFMDRPNSLFIEQNWLNFIPCFFDAGIGVFRHPGCNVSHWNIHERFISKKDGKYFVNEIYPLIFYHFSQVDIEGRNFSNISHYQAPSFDSKGLYDLYNEYCDRVIENRYSIYAKLSYSYDYFSNGRKLADVHRRLYRALLEQGYDIPDPFDANKPFYKLLDENGLILDIESSAIINRKSFKDINKQASNLFKSLRFIQRVFGLKIYLLIKKTGWFIQDDNNQLFLVKGYDNYFKKK